jgi:tetratricopeptide (TPR) repeat protein
MSDPLRSDARPTELLTGAERTARIEQLLLTGLDHYFAADYDHAINLWTRVLFLDRHHDRARAYIERARSAQAERQRESEALLHQGLQAFDEGEVDRARQLLSAAIDHGAPHDMALGVLDRIERLEVGQHAAPVARARQAPARTRPAELTGHKRPARARALAMTWLISLAVVALLAATAWELSLEDLTAWTWWPQSPAGAPSSIPASVRSLPVAGASEAHYARAQAHFAAGRLHQALAALDQVPIGDSRRVDADLLRARIQRELLALAVPAASASEAALAGVPDE